MNNKKIVIDAGHGGADSGAVGNGIVEKDLTLLISNYMYDRFKELGVPVKMTRTSDIELTSDNRPKKVLDSFGNSSNVIVISNHINAGGAEGAEVIYALRNGSTLSELILNNLSKEGQKIRKYYQRRLPTNPSKDYYYMLRETPNTEAVIVEYGFLDNMKDAAKLKNNYKRYAEAVVRAVMEYIGLPYNTNVGDAYIVKSGDTLWTIAKNYGLSVQELKDLNGLTSNTLSVGQKLIVKKNEVDEVVSPNDEYYVVEPGDTLYSIAKKNGLYVEDLIYLNNLKNNTLSIGQKLILKPDISLSNSYVVKRGDTLYSIALKNGTTVDKIKVINNLSNNTLSVGQVLQLPVSEDLYNVYTVKAGDTLYSLALKFGVSVDELKVLNNLSTDNLSIGQKLLIP